MKPMLAGKFDQQKVEKLLPIYMQPKYDGIRVLVHGGVAFTRSLKPVRSQQVQSMIAFNREMFEGKDGELICGDPTAPDCYRRTMTSVQSFDKPDDELRFYVFDQWDSTEVFEERLLSLTCDVEQGRWHERMTLSETLLADDMEQIRAYEQDLLGKGHEGVILRNPKSYYKFGRGTPTRGELIKMKQFVDTEGRVVDFHELFHNGNPAEINELGHTMHSGHKENLVPMDTLGALEVRGYFSDGTEYTVRIGTGFDQQQRDEIWHCREDYVGQIVKFKYFDGGIKEAPRFPVFLGFRDEDDAGEPPKQKDMFT